MCNHTAPEEVQVGYYKEIPFQKQRWCTGTAAQWDGGVTVLGGVKICVCGTEEHGLVDVVWMGWWLDLKGLFQPLWFYDQVVGVPENLFQWMWFYDSEVPKCKLVAWNEEQNQQDMTSKCFEDQVVGGCCVEKSYFSIFIVFNVLAISIYPM